MATCFRTKGIEQPIDDGPGKPVHIWARTGRKPLLAGGNADGDVAMLEQPASACWSATTTPEREFAYDAGAEQALAEAAERGWTVVSMQERLRDGVRPVTDREAMARRRCDESLAAEAARAARC